MFASQLHLEAQTPAAPNWRAFTQLFDTASAREGIVGASVVFVRGGVVTAQHQFGFADRAKGKPVTPRTIFHFASITKTLTAIAIMQLRDRGLVSLDDPVVKYVPELRLVHDAYGSIDSVTIRMLLSHSSGFQNPTWPWTQGKPWEPFEPTEWAQLVAMLPYEELLFKPGSRFSYSNPGFIYLARIIEKLTGDPWETYVQKNIFSPLDLSRSYFGVTPYYAAAGRSHNYSISRDSASGRDSLTDNGPDFDPGITIPNGGWNAPLTDVAKYLAFLANAARGDTALENRYNVVLPHRDFEEMWRARFPTNSENASHGSAEEWMGMSFFIIRRGTKTFVGHTGEQAGFTSFIYVNPVNGNAVVAAFNTLTSRPSAFRIIREAALQMIAQK
ncbi:MAG: serine hydrolase domain-containing protein [Gemmatimonadaceae bacterium]